MSRDTWIALAVLLAAGCAAAPVATKERVSVRSDAQSAPPPTLEREVRYYRDEQGTVWDDRGRRQDATAPRTP